MPFLKSYELGLAFQIDLLAYLWPKLGGILIQWIYLFALRLAVSYSLLYSVREIWFVSTCHLRQGNSCVRAPLRLRMTSIRIAFGLSIGVDTTL